MGVREHARVSFDQSFVPLVVVFTHSLFKMPLPSHVCQSDPYDLNFNF